MDYTKGQTLLTFEKALKENYLPVWQNQLGIEPSALLGKIKKVPLKSNKVVAASPVGLSGGFGFGAEGQATPAPGNVNFERFETYAKDMYVDVCVSVKAVELTDSSGAMANALTTEVDAAYNAAKWHMGRTLFGNGTGKLTTCEASENSNVIKVADTKYLKEGIIIDIYAKDATTPQTNGKQRRIKSIDRTNKTITIEGDAATFAEGFITVQNSLNREITGLGAIFDDSIKTIYGVDKGDNPYLKPVIYDAETSVTDGLITKVLRAAEDEKGSNVNMFLCGNDAYDRYVDYLRESNIRVEDRTATITGGFKAIKFAFGNREVEIVNEKFVPDTEMWGVDTNTLELHTKNWNFAQLQGGSIFNLMEGSSIYRALLTNFGDLICSKPGGCIRLYNC